MAVESVAIIQFFYNNLINDTVKTVWRDSGYSQWLKYLIITWICERDL